MVVTDVDSGDAVVAAVGDDVQLLPATTDDGEDVYIVNVLRRISCIDEKSTVGERWQASHGRPDKTGKYRMIIELRHDPTRIGNAQIFRVEGWEVALIVSESLAREFFAGVPGIMLTSVT